MANTLIELNDTPSEYSGKALTFLRVNANETGISFASAELDDLNDVQTSGAYVPTGGQALIYSSAAGVWRPGTVDVYSAGNGISKSVLTLNVVAGATGGLTSNANGVYITDIANVSGTWGNASYVPRLTINSKGQITSVTPTLVTATQATTITNSFVGNVNGTAGQISVTGGTGNNSNATLNLVATGVTSGTYGNATLIPRITVDTYGRIQNVDTVAVSGAGVGGNGTSLGFANILVAGQTTVSADRAEDTLTLVAGSGITITTTANADTVTFSSDPGNIDLADLNDVDASGIANGQVLIWNSSTSKFEAGNMAAGGGAGNSNLSLTNFSVTTASPSGNGALTYSNTTGVFTFTPANISAVTQSLSWNASTYVLSISSGNSVNLSVLKDSDTDAQTLSLNGNIITISGSNSSVNLTSALGNVAGNYGDSNVATYLSTNSYATQTYVNTANTNMKTYVDAGLANAAGNYGNSNVASYLSVNNYATQSYVTTQINNLTAGAPAALNTLAEIANALNNSNSTLATVAFTGNHSSLTNRPSLSLASNTYLLYDGSNVDLSNVIGQQGIQGNTGPQGVSVSSASISGSNLLLTLSNAATIDAGNVRGPQGTQGLQGDGNAGIANATVAGNNNLIIGLVNGTYINAGNVKGLQGDQGNAGVGITSVSLVSSNLVLNYSNTSTQDVGNIRGPQGNAGTNGVSISTATVNGSGNLIITLSNSSTVDAGNVRGAAGASGIQLSNISVTSNSPSGNGSLTYSNVTGVFTFTPAVGLTATGVTAGTYGNATTMPQFTVDSFGRITGVSNIAISAGGGGNANTGNVTFSDQILIGTGSNDGSGGLYLAPGNASIANSAVQYLRVRGGDVATHIHLDTGNNAYFDQYFGDDGKYVKLANTGNVQIGSNDANGNSAQWTFGTDGNLTTPSNLVIGPGPGSGSSILQYDAALQILGEGANSVVQLGWTANTSAPDSVTSIAMNYPGGGEGNVLIAVGNNATTVNYWLFDNTGNLTLPGNSFTVNYANGSQVSLGGGGGAIIQRFKLNYSTTGTLANTSNLSAGISSVTIDSASGGECTINFTGYYYPPGSIMLYGYDRTNNKYLISHLETTMGQREVPGGGTAGSPTAFDGATSETVVKLKLREAETGASRAFGTTTHAWIQFVMYD
jgi:hypothetical protein